MLLLAVAAGMALFDWNWLRAPVVNHITEKSGRAVRVDDLHVKLGWTLQPTVRLRGVYVPNAHWASSQQPLIDAREVEFTFSLVSLWHRRPIVSRIVLTDASVDMERRPDGLRNWRLLNPEDRGPGTVRVQTLQAQNTKLRFINGNIDLEMLASSTPIEGRAQGTQSTEKVSLPNNLAFEGSYKGVRFTAAGVGGDVLSFHDSGLLFPVRGYLTAGKTRADVDGTFTDIFDFGPFDAKLHITGPTLSRMHPFIEFEPPGSRTYVLDAQIKRRARVYTFSQLHGRVGDTDIAGDATVDRSVERPLINADLRSERADVADLVFLIGANYQPGGLSARAAPAPAKANQPGGTGAPADTKISGSARGDRMRKADAHLKLEIKQLIAGAPRLIESVRLRADLVDGVLLLPDLAVGAAGGHVTGTADYDGHVAHVNLDSRDLRLENLVPALPSTVTNRGVVRSRLRMTGHGETVAAVVASSSGTLTAIVEDGRISNLVDAKLGLNIGKVVGVKVRGDRDIALDCGAVAFKFINGVGKSEMLMLDTEQTHVDGTGTIDLRDRNIDFLLTPRPKNPGLLTLNSSIHLQGDIRKPGIKIEKRAPLERGGSNTAPATIAALFRPLYSARQPQGQCRTVLDIAGTPARSPSAGG